MEFEYTLVNAEGIPGWEIKEIERGLADVFYVCQQDFEAMQDVGHEIHVIDVNDVDYTGVPAVVSAIEIESDDTIQVDLDCRNIQYNPVSLDALAKEVSEGEIALPFDLDYRTGVENCNWDNLAFLAEEKKIDIHALRRVMDGETNLCIRCRKNYEFCDCDHDKDLYPS